MLVSTVSQIKEMSIGAIVESIEGRLVKLYAHQSGGGQHGPWTMQSGEFHDATGSMQIVFTNKPDMIKWLGKDMKIASHKSTRGLIGVKVDQKAGFPIQIKVSASAEVTEGSGFAEKAESPWSGQTTAPPKDPVEALTKGIWPILNTFHLIEMLVWLQCDRATTELGIASTSENFGGKCSAVFRELKAMGLVEKMPDHDFLSAITDSLKSEGLPEDQF